MSYLDVKDIDGAIAPTRLIRVYSGTMVDAWTGRTLDDRNGCSLADIRRVVEKEGRPVDVEARPGTWVRVWPDGCYLPIREPAAMIRRRALVGERIKKVRKEKRRNRRRARIVRLIGALGWADADSGSGQDGGR